MEISGFTLEELLNRPEDPITTASTLGVLDLTVRAYNALSDAGIKTIGDLISHTPQEIRSIRHLGRVSFASIQSELGRHGFVWNSSAITEQHKV